MPVKEKLSRISLYTLIPSKPINRRITIKEEPLSSKPFVISPKRNIHTKFFGRVKELDYIRTLYSQMLQRVKDQNAGKEINLKPIAIAISGEAGIGKSRLVSEFVNQIRRSIHHKQDNIISGRNLSTGQNPYGLFSKIPGSIWQSNMKDSDYSNNVMINNSIKEFIFKSAQEANKHNMPLVLVMEDMQWVDESSVAALEHVMKSINLFSDQTQPQILFVLNFRNKFRPSKILRRECDYREVELKGFTEEETDGFISSIAPGNMIEKNRQVIASRSDGNPFNIEEWCGLFDVSRSSAGVPGTVKELLVEKVSGLSEEERIILTIASVLGRKFDIKLINEILNRAGKEKAIQETTNSLVEKRYFLNLTGNIYEFRHDILQETIYEKLKTNIKQNLHLLAGNAIEENYPHKLNEYYYELARHYTNAGSGNKSIEYLEKAGDKAKNSHEHERAMRYYLKLLKKSEASKKYNTIFKMCDVHMNKGEWNKQKEFCVRILAENKGLDKRLKAECYKRIGNCFRLKGDYADALKQHKKAYIIYDKIYDVQGRIDIVEREAKVMISMGKFKEALNSFEIIYKISQKENYTEPFKNALMGLGIVNAKIGKYEEAIRYNDKLLEYSIKNNDKQSTITAKINKAESLFFMGDLEQADFLYSEALRLAEKIHQLQDIPVCLGNIGIIHYTKHNNKQALDYFEKQLNGFINLGDKAGISRAHGLIGLCHISLGSYDKAIYFLNKQLNLSKELKRKQSIALCLGNIGIVHNLKGEFEKANRCFEKQLAMDTKMQNWEGVFRAICNLGIQHKNLLKFNKALKFLNKALKLAQHKGIQNISLALLSYAEILMNLERYSEAISVAKKAAEELKLYTNSVAETIAFLIAEKCRVLSECQCGEITDKVSLENFYNNLKSRAKNCINTDEKAMISFETWKMLLRFPEDTFNMQVNRIRAETKKLYARLYQETPQFEFKSRLAELSHSKN